MCNKQQQKKDTERMNWTGGKGKVVWLRINNKIEQSTQCNCTFLNKMQIKFYLFVV